MDEPKQEPAEPVAPNPPAERAPPEPSASASAESSEATPTKKKRRSSWEALASMFNVATTPEPEAAESAPDESIGQPAESARAVDAPRASQPASRRPSDPELSIFNEESDSDDNAALDSLFPAAKREASSKVDAWAKPKRVVDDVSWDDDDEYSAKSDTVEDRLADEVSDDLDDSESVEPASDDEEPRRGRRRRRRGRRGGKTRDGDAPAASGSQADDDAPVAKSAASWKEAAAWDDDLDVDVEPGDDWPEPESFSEELDSPPPKASRADPEEEEEGEAVRRSSRRRRGRSRGRDREAVGDRDQPRQPARPPRAAQPESRGRDVEEPGDDFSEDLVDEAPAPSLRRPTDSDEPARGKRSRRRRPRREASDDRPPRDSEHAKLEDESDGDSEEAVEKHRNIPTWNDALEPIVLANTENHKRNEGRGGSRGGGRSRGGRR